MPQSTIDEALDTGKEALIALIESVEKSPAVDVTDADYSAMKVSEIMARLRKIGVTDEVMDEADGDKTSLVAMLTNAEAKLGGNKGAPGPSTVVDKSMPAKVLLVIGEVGDGKSTLVNGLRDLSVGGDKCAVGRDSAGVSKEVVSYVGKPINGQKIQILDTPGIGDQNVKPPELITLIQETLASDQRIDGVIVTTKIHDGRLKMGAQVVKALVEEAMIADTGVDKWDSIILAGTQRDAAESGAFDEEGQPTCIEQFTYPKEKVSTIKKDNGEVQIKPMGTVASFFENAPSGWGKYALTSKKDYSQLEEQIAKLPSLPIKYKKLEPMEVAELLADVVNIKKEAFLKEIKDAQDAMQKKFEADVARMDAEHKQEMANASEEQRVELQKMEDQRKAEKAQLDGQIVDLDKKRKAAEAKAAKERAKIKEESDKKYAELNERNQKAMEEMAKKSEQEQQEMKAKMQQEKLELTQTVNAQKDAAAAEKNKLDLELQAIKAQQMQNMMHDRQQVVTETSGARYIQVGPNRTKKYIRDCSSDESSSDDEPVARRVPRPQKKRGGNGCCPATQANGRTCGRPITRSWGCGYHDK